MSPRWCDEHKSEDSSPDLSLNQTRLQLRGWTFIAVRDLSPGIVDRENYMLEHIFSLKTRYGGRERGPGNPRVFCTL